MENKEWFFWRNRWLFILAAIGSAAWLGNFWRFPFQVFDHWGLEFIVAYFVMLIIMWIGLLIWEVALGQKTQKWAPNAIWSLSKFFKRIWWWAIFVAATIVTYYSVVISWSLSYLYHSVLSLFQDTFAWEKAESTQEFFFENVLMLSDWVAEWGSISIPVVLWLIVTWVLIYLFTFKSAKSVGPVVAFTATIPVVLLLILAIRAITLPWGMDGVSHLLQFDAQNLWNFSLWSAAAWQIFFTLSLSAGVMIAYWALKQKGSEIANSWFLVVIWNTIISLISAVAVYWALGFISKEQWTAIAEMDGWPMLVFVTFPEILSEFPALSWLFAVLFFGSIFLLAVDSAMSLVESASKGIRDNFPKLWPEKMMLILSIILGLWGLIYSFWNWLYILDIVDYYITTFWMLTAWLFTMWLLLYNWKDMTTFISNNSWKITNAIFNRWYLMASWWISVIILIVLYYQEIQDWILNYEEFDPVYNMIWFGLYVGAFVVWIILNFLQEKS